MDDPFLRSRQSLASDGGRGWLLAAAGVTLLLAAWAAWFGLARVGVYAVSQEARLEVATAVQRVQASVGGRIVERRAEIGQSVESGDVLFQIEAATERARLHELEERLDSLLEQQRALEEQLRLEAQVLTEEARAARASLAEARARLEESRAAADFAEDDASRTAELQQEGLVSEVELQAKRSEARQKRAAAERDAQSAQRLESELQALRERRSAERAERERDLERLRGDEAETRAALQRLGVDVERRLVRAPVAGRVAEVAELAQNAFVEEGDHLASIIPSGDEVRVVAWFPPSEAFGRIQEGLPCRLRLEGFSWMRYGSLSAVVTRVAEETRSGRVRVEAALRRDVASEVPVEHGLPGALEVEVERVSPATLALRAAGRRLGRRPPTEAGRESG